MIGLEVTISKKSLRLIENIPDKVEYVLNLGVDDVLATIELIQIHKYTTGAFPSRPPGSTYRRTFTLRRSSKTRRGSRRLPELSGEWFADPGIAPYAEEVIGLRQDQKEIHRGRWKSLEQVTQEIEEMAPELIEDRLNEIQI